MFIVQGNGLNPINLSHDIHIWDLKMYAMLSFCIIFFGKLTQSEATILDRDEMGIMNLSTEHIPADTIHCSFRRNYIQRIATNIFVGLPVVSKIYLNQNDIFEISDYAFSGVPSLIFLQLGANNLKIIKKYMFRGLSNLDLLGLLNNQIFIIEEESFSDLSSLRKLYLLNNDLQTISAEIFHPINHPASLDIFQIDQNPLICDSCLCWILQSTWVTPTTPGTTECAGPTQLIGRKWSSLMADDLNCFNITCEIEGKGTSMGECF